MIFILKSLKINPLIAGGAGTGDQPRNDTP